MDIETVTLPNQDGVQIPVVISLSGRYLNKLFTIDYVKFADIVKTGNINLIDKLVTELWLEFFEFLDNNPHSETIFVHNLGGFDGVFLYKALLKTRSKDFVKAIIDTKNKFITITYQIPGGNKFIWKDSYRVFPVSLKDLCKTFGVEGKTC